VFSRFSEEYVLILVSEKSKEIFEKNKNSILGYLEKEKLFGHLI